MSMIHVSSLWLSPDTSIPVSHKLLSLIEKELNSTLSRLSVGEIDMFLMITSKPCISRASFTLDQSMKSVSDMYYGITLPISSFQEKEGLNKLFVSMLMDIVEKFFLVHFRGSRMIKTEFENMKKNVLKRLEEAPEDFLYKDPLGGMDLIIP